MKLSVFYAAAVSLVVVLSVECRNHGRPVVEPQPIEPHLLSSTLPQPVLLQLPSSDNQYLWPNSDGYLQKPELSLEIQESQMKIDEPSCPAGFFSAGGSDKCYLYDDNHRSWDETNNWCQSKNLRMAETEDPVALRSHLVYNLGVPSYTWMGAKGNNNSQVWLSGKVLSNSDPSWYQGTDINTQSDANKCLTLLSTKGFTKLHPTNPYFAFPCKMLYKTLCEQKPSCPAGFFSAGGSDQCYRLYDDIRRTWEEANNWCQSKNLTLAETEDPVALRAYVTDIQVQLTLPFYTWIGAKGNGYSQVWQSGKVLSNSDPRWSPWAPNNKRSNPDYCLLLLSIRHETDRNPTTPYHAFKCNSKLLTICEQAKATPCTCGIPNIQRIVGGADVDPARKYPWQVRLGRGLPGFNCGGTIINNRWILTAAHCITKNYTDCKLRDDLVSLTVVVGDHNIYQTTDDDSNTREYTIKTFLPHPDYIRNCGTLKYNFALLEVNEAIPFNNIIRPICLPKDDSKTYEGQTGTATGWGRLSDGSLSYTLQELQVPILAKDKCYNYPDVMLCASGEADKNICVGDYGGPIAVIENNKYVQVGVASDAGGRNCSAPYPGIFARVSKVLPWIATTTANGKTCG